MNIFLYCFFIIIFLIIICSIKITITYTNKLDFKIYIFNHFKIYDFKMSNRKIEKVSIEGAHEIYEIITKKIHIKQFIAMLKEIRKHLKKIYISKFNLNICFKNDYLFITTYFIPFLAYTIPKILSVFSLSKECNYDITSNSYFNFNFSCIIKVKLTDIIYIVSKLFYIYVKVGLKNGKTKHIRKLDRCYNE